MSFSDIQVSKTEFGFHLVLEGTVQDKQITQSLSRYQESVSLNTFLRINTMAHTLPVSSKLKKNYKNKKMQ